MKIQENDNLKKTISFNKQYISLNNNYFTIINNSRISPKFSFLFLFLAVIFFFIIMSIKIRKIKLNIKLSRKSTIKTQNEFLFLEKLKTILDEDEILENELMSKHTTFQLGGPAKFFVKPKSINKIKKLLILCREYSIEYFILGNGSNLLVSDKGFDGLVININEDYFSDFKLEQLDKNHYKVIVGGGMLLTNLAKRLCLLSLSGLEDIIDIPGTVGGGIIMNATSGSKKGLIRDSLDKVKVITPEGEIKELSKIECKLVIKGSFLKENKFMVIEAIFKLIKGDKMIIQKTMTTLTGIRYIKQPRYFPNAGCFFVWNEQFGSQYEKYKESNLVGFKVGDAMIFPNNIAFIVNLGNAKSSDVYKIVTWVENIIKSKYGINIKREVVILGDFT